MLVKPWWLWFICTGFTSGSSFLLPGILGIRSHYHLECYSSTAVVWIWIFSLKRSSCVESLFTSDWIQLLLRGDSLVKMLTWSVDQSSSLMESEFDGIFVGTWNFGRCGSLVQCFWQLTCPGPFSLSLLLASIYPSSALLQAYGVCHSSRKFTNTFTSEKDRLHSPYCAVTYTCSPHTAWCPALLFTKWSFHSLTRSTPDACRELYAMLLLFLLFFFLDISSLSF